MPEIKLEDLIAKQQQLVAMAEQIQHEKDANKIVEMAPAIQKAGEELQELAREFEAQQNKKWGVTKAGHTEIALTREQRERVKRETGLSMETLLVKDDSGAFAKGMPGTTPQAIDVFIMDYARKLKLETEAHEKARIDLENQLRYLEGLSPQHAEQVAKVRADPAFANVLKKPGS